MPESSSSEQDQLIKNPFRFYFNRNKLLTYGAMSAVILTNAVDAVIPMIMGQAIDLIANEQDISRITEKVLIILGLASLLSIFRYLWRIWWGRYHHGAAHDLRLRVFNKLTSLGPSFFQKKPVGELMNLLIADINAFRMGVGPGTLIFLDGLFYLAVIPPMMISISLTWTLKTMILMPFIPFAMGRIMKLIQQGFRIQQDRFSEVSGTSQEMASGIRVIKSYAQEKNQTRVFNYISRKYELACNYTAKVDSMFGPVMNLGVTGGSVILLIVGAPEVIKGQVTIGGFFAFYQYIQKMIWPVSALGMGNSMRSQARASFKRIVEVLKEPVDRPDNGNKEILQLDQLKVNDLSFTYPGEKEPTLKNVSFEVKTGETLGIVGATGAGKSTLVELLTRMYPVESGKIQYNKNSIEEIKLKSLRENITLIPQESFLFSASVLDNIQLDRAYDLDKIQEVTDIVCVTEEIQKMTHGFESELGERGINLSGGQKQRLSMARALIRKSPMVIFDDSLSAVDANTEKQIVRELKKNLQNKNGILKSTIIVSHQISSVQWADQILVLNKGEVEAIGQHKDLLHSSPTYQSLYLLQQKGGEA